MNIKTEHILDAAQTANAKYDAMAKVLFSNREILSPVLKEVVQEFRDCTYEEIINYIDPDSIANEAVDDVSVFVKGTPAEMSSPSDKIIRYDTRFKAINPKLSSGELHFYLHIDLEVQNDYKPDNPKYPIIKRAIYYGAREISSQLGVLTDETNYDVLQKAYSIWICNENIPKNLINTVTRYTLTRHDIIGQCRESKADFDLLEIIMIRRGNNEGKESIFDYLTGVFTANFDQLEPYIGKSERTQEIKEEVRTMSGLGQSIYNEGISVGEARGISIGRNEGRNEAAKEYEAQLFAANAEIAKLKAMIAAKN